MADHYVKRLATPLPLADAAAIVDQALRLGNEAGILPLTVAVLDSGGHLVAFKRADGSGILRGDIATGKAYGALGMGPSMYIRDPDGNTVELKGPPSVSPSVTARP